MFRKRFKPKCQKRGELQGLSALAPYRKHGPSTVILVSFLLNAQKINFAEFQHFSNSDKFFSAVDEKQFFRLIWYDLISVHRIMLNFSQKLLFFRNRNFYAERKRSRWICCWLIQKLLWSSIRPTKLYCCSFLLICTKFAFFVMQNSYLYSPFKKDLSSGFSFWIKTS